MFNLYYSDSIENVKGSINYDNYKNFKISNSEKEEEVKFIIDEIQVLSISYTKIDEILREVIRDGEFLFKWYKYFIGSNILKEDVNDRFINLGFNNVRAIISKDIVSNTEITDSIYTCGAIFFDKLIEKAKRENYTNIILIGDKYIKKIIVLTLLFKICTAKIKA